MTRTTTTTRIVARNLHDAVQVFSLRSAIFIYFQYSFLLGLFCSAWYLLRCWCVRSFVFATFPVFRLPLAGARALGTLLAPLEKLEIIRIKKKNGKTNTKQCVVTHNTHSVSGVRFLHFVVVRVWSWFDGLAQLLENNFHVSWVFVNVPIYIYI